MCSSDLTATDFYDEEPQVVAFMMNTFFKKEVLDRLNSGMMEIGRASCRERV